MTSEETLNEVIREETECVFKISERLWTCPIFEPFLISINLCQSMIVRCEYFFGSARISRKLFLAILNGHH